MESVIVLLSSSSSEEEDEQAHANGRARAQMASSPRSAPRRASLSPAPSPAASSGSGDLRARRVAAAARRRPARCLSSDSDDEGEAAVLHARKRRAPAARAAPSRQRAPVSPTKRRAASPAAARRAQDRAEAKRQRAEKAQREKAEKEQRRLSREMHSHESGRKAEENTQLVLDKNLAVTGAGAAIIKFFAEKDTGAGKEKDQDKPKRLETEELPVAGTAVWRRYFREYEASQAGGASQSQSQAVYGMPAGAPSGAQFGNESQCSYAFEWRWETCAALLVVMEPVAFAQAAAGNRLGVMAEAKLRESGLPVGSTAHVVTYQLEPTLRANEKDRYKSALAQQQGVQGGSNVGVAQLPDRQAMPSLLARAHVGCASLSLHLCRDHRAVGEQVERLTQAIAKRPYEVDQSYLDIFGSKAKPKAKTYSVGSTAALSAQQSMFVNILAAIPGVGAEYAHAIATRYPSLYALREAFAAQGAAATAGIVRERAGSGEGGGAARKFGPAMSRRLMRLLSAIDANEVINSS